MDRRAYLGLTGAVLVAGFVGCVEEGTPDADDPGGGADADDDGAEDAGEDTDGSSDTDDVPADCHLVRQAAFGAADPIETSATVDVADTSDRKLAEHCARAAADAAFAYLDQQSEFDLAAADWIFAGWRYDGDTHSAQVTVKAVQNRDRDGYPVCPDPTFDFEDAVAALPREVTVSLALADSDVQRECTHTIRIRQRVFHED